MSPAAAPGQEQRAAQETRELEAILAGTDEDALRDAIRLMEPADVRAISTGKGHIHPCPNAMLWRLSNIETMTVSETAHAVARAQIELRERGRRIVRAVLRHLGHSYSGTNGWWITAYATAQARLGFINIAHGVAVETDLQLSADLVQALTVPSQPEGPQVSGAAAWTTPAISDAHPATAPGGWRQLGVDIRTGADDDEPLRVDARIIRWGLQTCYDWPGEPGATTLDGTPFERTPPSQWPLPRVAAERAATLAQERMAGATLALIGERGLRAIVGESLGPDATAGQRYQAIRALTDAQQRPAWASGGLLAGFTRNAYGSVVNDALTKTTVVRVGEWAGYPGSEPEPSWMELLRSALGYVLCEHLLPVADALARQLLPLYRARAPEHYPDDRERIAWPMEQDFSDALQPAAAEIASELLHSTAGDMADAETRLREALYQDGPIEMDVPLKPAAGEHPPH